MAVDPGPQSNLIVGCGLDPATERPTIHHTLHTPDQVAEAIVQELRSDATATGGKTTANRHGETPCHPSRWIQPEDAVR